MDNQLLQCLHHSKLMLMYAQQQEWNEFILLHPKWESEVNHCLIENSPQTNAENLESVLTELIGDVDEIRGLIEGRMSQLENDFSQAVQQKKAMDSYLK